jgi:hypothetical protein
LHDSIERWMTTQQISRAPFDNPRKMYTGQSVAQRTQHRQAMETVADGGEADDEDSWAMQGHGKFSRHAVWGCGSVLGTMAPNNGTFSIRIATF